VLSVPLKINLPFLGGNFLLLYAPSRSVSIEKVFKKVPKTDFIRPVMFKKALALG